MAIWKNLAFTILRQTAHSNMILNKFFNSNSTYIKIIKIEGSILIDNRVIRGFFIYPPR